MTEENIFTINMSPLRLWTHLADFKAFALWHPNYVFGDQVELNTAIPLHYALFRGRYWIRAEAGINDFDKPDRLGWTVGVGGVPVYWETYSIQVNGTETEVRHVVEYRGVFGFIMSLTLRRALRHRIKNQDVAFVCFLKKQMRSSTSGSNRQRRRAQVAQYSRKDG
ncbi:MAG: SRPBCC family protein [Sphingobium sp.]|nr:SRPBCC family protein [Sphingobium sp.]